MNVEMTPIGDITPYPENPRNNKQAIDKVAASLKEYGWQQPIVVDAAGVIVVGHTRYLAAQKLGMDEVPVTVAEHLTDEQVKAYRIADNRTGEEAEWDIEKLGLELRSLDDLGIDLSLTGFDSLEIDKLFDPKITRKSGDDDMPDTVEKLAQPGDVWVLGNHRLIVGDSTDPDVVASLMDGKKAHMVWTDPPYNVDLGSTDTPEQAAARNRRTDGMNILNDKMDESTFVDFLTDAFVNALDHTVKGGAIYIAHADNHGLSFRAAMINSGWLHKQCLIWVKQHFVMGRQDYQWQHEPILYGWKKGASHRWYGTRNEPTTIAVDRPMRSEEHPTMKPLELVAKMVNNSSKRGNIVLDLFGGSGTTLIACEKHGRSCRMVEMDPHYADVIIRRWQDYTGEEAEKLTSEAA